MFRILYIFMVRLKRYEPVKKGLKFNTGNVRSMYRIDVNPISSITLLSFDLYSIFIWYQKLQFLFNHIDNYFVFLIKLCFVLNDMYKLK